MDTESFLKIIGELYVQNRTRQQKINDFQAQLQEQTQAIQVLTANKQASEMVWNAIKEEYPEIKKMIDKGIQSPKKIEASMIGNNE